LPKVQRKQVVPLTTEQVAAVRDALPPQLQALVTLAAGTGMHQGECFGLTVDRVRFLERTVAVDRQLVTVQGHAPGTGTTEDASEQPEHPAAAGSHGCAGGASGHASAVEALDTYSHLWPDSDDRTRDAIDSELGAKSC
jgi:hypothetical protein